MCIAMRGSQCAAYFVDLCNQSEGEEGESGIEKKGRRESPRIDDAHVVDSTSSRACIG